MGIEVSTGMIVRPPTGTVARQEFGAQQSHALAETATAQLAAQARSLVEARYIMAMQRPRSWDNVRQRLLRECQSPAFAGEALYKKPIGSGVTGLSIRFVEEALQLMGNVTPESITLYDDDEKRIVRFQVTDFESNVVHSRDVTIEKKVERNSAPEGLRVYGQRRGSRGQAVFIVEATEDDLFNKTLAAESKHVRSLALRLIPAAIKAECEAVIRKTLEDEAVKDPGAERRAVLDGFGRLNIMPSHLEQYLGHGIDTTTPAEIVELRQVWRALEQGEANWADALAHKQISRGDAASPPNPTASPARGAAAAKAELAKRQAPAVAAPTGETPPEAEPPPAKETKARGRRSAPPTETAPAPATQESLAVGNPPGVPQGGPVVLLDHADELAMQELELNAKDLADNPGSLAWFESSLAPLPPCARKTRLVARLNEVRAAIAAEEAAADAAAQEP